MLHPHKHKTTMSSEVVFYSPQPNKYAASQMAASQFAQDFPQGSTQAGPDGVGLMLPPYTSPVIESKNPIQHCPSMHIGDGETTNCTSAARQYRRNNDDQYDLVKDSNDVNIEDVDAIFSDEHLPDTDSNNKGCFLFTSPKMMMDMYKGFGPATTFTPITPQDAEAMKPKV